jgi:ABC-type lipoprotein export system ATPase subunit/predicted acetyltransferase
MKDIKLNYNIINDKYTEYLYEAYDIQDKNISEVIIKNKINIDFEWNIGVIYGGSGSGKSTLLKQFGEIKEVEFDNTKSLISNFDWLEPIDAANLLTSIGLSSVPTWLRSYNILSNGEQYRARMAYLIGKAQIGDIILIDEFTSVVDRDVAKAMSYSIGKYIRKKNLKVIFASCHFDIMEWLMPCFIYSPNKERVERLECLRRPEIKLEVFRCRYEAWKLFKQHHYLSQDLNKASKCFGAIWENKIIGFIGILPLPHPNMKNCFRVTRLVVLPDYQGLGIGFAFNNYIGSLYKKIGCRYFIKTSNPAIGEKLVNSKDWKETSKSRKLFDKKSLKQMSRNIWGYNNKNNTYSTEFIGQFSNDDESIITFNIDAYRDISQNQLSLF